MNSFDFNLNLDDPVRRRAARVVANNSHSVVDSKVFRINVKVVVVLCAVGIGENAFLQNTE
jgi:hypothetical protein